jgi:cyclopropane-fatty-acyl-phospholipid synthase
MGMDPNEEVDPVFPVGILGTRSTNLKVRGTGYWTPTRMQRSQVVDAYTNSLQHPARIFDRWLAARLQRAIAPAAVRLELWDGSSPYSRDMSPIGSVLVHDRAALIGLILDPDLWFGDAYTAGRLDIRGDLGTVVEALTRATLGPPTWRERVRGALERPNSLASARRNVRHHYDLGNEFYQQWLDEDLVYTCAYFEDPQMGLEAAQHAKFDLVCRKLRLQPGESVVEAGCGWGTLALHMARQYGVRVRAFNVSREQLAYARDRAQREGMTDRVEFIDDDYRNVRGEYDAFVSVGMLEHVGLHHYESLSEVLRRVVRRDSGRGLLHFIGRDAPRPLNAWAQRRIFPGAYPPTLAEVATRVLTPAGMSIVDVENLRLHYARTLAHWRARFKNAEEQVRAEYGANFHRAWELYLAASQAAFTTGWMQLFQVVFVPLETAPPYWTRAEMYARTNDAKL